MHLTFRFRVLPSRRQHRALERILESQRELYNAALQERLEAHRKAGINRTFYDQTKALAELRADDPEYRALPANLQRATLKRVDLAYQGFFRRWSRGQKPGFPRFRGKGRFDSFGFREWCGIALSGPRLRFKGMPGGLRLHIHRPLPDHPDIRSCLFKRNASGWTIALCLRVKEGAIRRNERQVGVDLGIKRFAALSDGGFIPSIRAARRAQARLRRLQRALARKQDGSSQRAKARKSLSRFHAGIARKRDAFLHRASARLIRDYDKIIVEQLNVKPLMRLPTAHSVHDAAFIKFISMLKYKAEKAGARVVEVDPHGTTQDCSMCGATGDVKLRDRYYQCGACGLSMDRDLNAARNILNRAAAGPGLRNASVEQTRAGGNLVPEGCNRQSGSRRSPKPSTPVR